MRKFLGFTLMLFTAFVLVACSTTEYTVTFDSTGGSPVAAVVVEKGSKVAEPEDPTRDGFTFIEWQLEEERFDFNTEIEADITLKALWEEDLTESFTVTFNTDGGTAIDPIIVVTGETITLPGAPLKDGFEFAGWFIDEALTTEFEETTAINADITLYAKWDETDSLFATLQYEAGGGTKNMDDGNNAESVGLNPDIFNVLSTPRQLPDNLHVGLNNAGQIRLYGHSDYASKNTLIVIATGKVITKIEITYLAGSNSPSSALLVLGDDELILSSEDIVNITKTYDNLSIDGFSIRNTQDGGSGNSQIFIEKIVITYEEGTAEKTFVKVPVLEVTIDYGYEIEDGALFFEPNDSFDLPSDPTRDGFNFEGWFLDAEYTEAATDLTAITEEFTLYAKWEEDEEETTNLGLPVVDGAITIASFLETKPEDAIIVGVVTSIAPYNSFSIEDETGAVALRIGGSNSGNIDFKVGDAIEANVKHNEFNGLIQAEVLEDTYTVHEGTYERLALVNLNETGLDEADLLSLQSRAVKLENVTVVSKSVYNSGTINIVVELDDKEITIRWDNRVAGFDNAVMVALNQGDVISIEGATLSWYNGPQLMVDKTEQIVLVNAVDTVTVTFNTDGGTAIDPIIVVTGETITLPEPPLRAGFEFAGWFIDEALTTEFEETTAINADITLYAKWEEREEGEEAVATISYEGEQITTAISEGDITSYFTITNSGSASFQVDFIHGTAQTKSIFNNGSKQTRLYVGSTLEINIPEGYVITNVKITSTQNGGVEINGDSYSDNNITIENLDSNTLTIKVNGGQFRINEIEITYSPNN